jgi:hypothetical protein
LVAEYAGEVRCDKGEHAGDLMEHRADRGERQPGHVGPVGVAQEEHGQFDRVVPQAVLETEAQDDQRDQGGVAQARGTAALPENPPHEEDRQAHEEHRRSRNDTPSWSRWWIEVSGESASMPSRDAARRSQDRVASGWSRRVLHSGRPWSFLEFAGVVGTSR